MNMRTASFRYEEELRSSFVEKAYVRWSQEDQNTKTKFIQLQESTCSEGRADLVLAKICKSWTNNVRVEHASLYQQPTCSKILNALKPNSMRTESWLLNRTNISVATLRSGLKKLIDVGLVLEKEDRKYVLSSDFYLPKAEILSYEFKLNNWKRALFQATRYRTFSHRVFVVMPPESLGPALKNLESFKRFNIGIMTHDSKGRTKIIFKPRKRAPYSKMHFLMALGMLGNANLSTQSDASLECLNRIYTCA